MLGKTDPQGNFLDSYIEEYFLPGNIPLENLLTYFETCKDVGSR